MLISRMFQPVEALFDCLPDIVFFVKDRDGRYAVVNETLVARCGAADKSALIGKTASQAHGRALGQGYEDQDRAVLGAGEPIVNQLELHVYPNRSIGWCLTNKRAVRDGDGAVAGVAGVSQDLRAPDMDHEDYRRLQPAILYTNENLARPPSVGALARIAGLSPYQLDRRMKRVFGLSAGQWVLKQRLDLARRALAHSPAPIAEIALNAGYRDQSAFTRQFRRATGLTPSAFRRAQRR